MFCTNEVTIPSNQIIHYWGQPLPNKPISFKMLTSLVIYHILKVNLIQNSYRKYGKLFHYILNFQNLRTLGKMFTILVQSFFPCTQPPQWKVFILKMIVSILKIFFTNEVRLLHKINWKIHSQELWDLLWKFERFTLKFWY